MWARLVVEKDFYFLFLIGLLSPLSSLVSISPVAPYLFLTFCIIIIYFINFSIYFLSLTLFLSCPHSTSPSSSCCRAADLVWSHYQPTLPGASLSLLVVVVVFLMVVGCFDCWRLADFG